MESERESRAASGVSRRTFLQGVGAGLAGSALLGAAESTHAAAGHDRAFHFIHVTDPHLNEPGTCRYFTDGQDRLQLMIDMLPVLQPRFVFCTGDVTEQSDLPSLQLYTRLVKQAACPVHTISGNHDGAISRENWKERVGTDHLAFDCEECTVIGVSMEHGWPAWGDYLEAELKAAKTRGQQQFVIGVHRPLYAYNSPAGDIMLGWSALAGEQALRVTNLCAQYGVKALLAGHLHIPIWDVYDTRSGTLSLAGPSLAGSPDKGPKGWLRGPGLNAFRIFSLDRGMLCWTDVTPGKWPAIAVLAPERNAMWSPVAAQDGADKLIVKPFSPAPITRVTCALPEKEPVALSPREDGCYETVLKVGNAAAAYIKLMITAADAEGHSASVEYPVLVRPAPKA